MDSKAKTENQALDMRFMSTSKTAYKIHIHMPDDTVVHKSVGFIKQGKEAGYKSAIMLRNELGSKAWGKHWKRILSDPKVFNRLPKNLEPILYTNPKKGQYYRAMPVINGKRICAKRSVDKYGKLGAYLACKKILLKAYERDLDLLSYMGRVPTVYLK